MNTLKNTFYVRQFQSHKEQLSNQLSIKIADLPVIDPSLNKYTNDLRSLTIDTVSTFIENLKAGNVELAFIILKGTKNIIENDKFPEYDDSINENVSETIIFKIDISKLKDWYVINHLSDIYNGIMSLNDMTEKKLNKLDPIMRITLIPNILQTHYFNACGQANYRNKNSLDGYYPYWDETTWNITAGINLNPFQNMNQKDANWEKVNGYSYAIRFYNALINTHDDKIREDHSALKKAIEKASAKDLTDKEDAQARVKNLKKAMRYECVTIKALSKQLEIIKRLQNTVELIAFFMLKYINGIVDFKNQTLIEEKDFSNHPNIRPTIRVHAANTNESRLSDLKTFDMIGPLPFVHQELDGKNVIYNPKEVISALRNKLGNVKNDKSLVELNKLYQRKETRQGLIAVFSDVNSGKPVKVYLDKDEFQIKFQNKSETIKADGKQLMPITDLLTFNQESLIDAVQDKLNNSTQIPSKIEKSTEKPDKNDELNSFKIDF